MDSHSATQGSFEADPTPSPRRYVGIARLYGDAGLAALQAAHVMVVGLGGVGSWTVEALVRSGVGRLSLVDLDEICLGNANRQLHTLTSTVGRPKAEVLAERVRAIDEGCAAEAIVDFFTARSAEAILARNPDLVVDAIDSLHAKVELIAACRERGLPIVVCGGAGGRVDPFAIRRDDLSATGGDGLLRALRRALRQRSVLSGAGPWRLPTVYSAEPQRFAGPDGCVSTTPVKRGPARLDCATGFGAATMVTGTFGFALAALAVEAIVDGVASAAVTPTAADAPSRSDGPAP